MASEQSNAGSQLRQLIPTVLTVSAVMIVVGVALLIGWELHGSASKGDVSVTESEFHITMPTTLHAGRHTFSVKNAGGEAHEFVVFRTDLAPTALPRKGTGVDEESPLLHNVADSGSSLEPGETRSVHATLTPGHYVVVCNLPTHYGLGMRIGLTVSN